MDAQTAANVAGIPVWRIVEDADKSRIMTYATKLSYDTITLLAQYTQLMAIGLARTDEGVVLYIDWQK